MLKGTHKMSDKLDEARKTINEADMQMAELFATSKQNVSLHINNILKDNELNADSVVKDYLTTASDGKNYTVVFYSLEMIMAVGFRVRSVRGVQFRQWANRHLTEYLRKGFVIDDERLKNPDGRPDYFDELLARYQSKLYNYILFAVRNQELAEDIFQETFVKAIVTITYRT